MFFSHFDLTWSVLNIWNFTAWDFENPCFFVWKRFCTPQIRWVSHFLFADFSNGEACEGQHLEIRQGCIGETHQESDHQHQGTSYGRSGVERCCTSIVVQCHCSHWATTVRCEESNGDGHFFFERHLGGNDRHPTCRTSTSFSTGQVLHWRPFGNSISHRIERWHQCTWAVGGTFVESQEPLDGNLRCCIHSGVLPVAWWRGNVWQHSIHLTHHSSSELPQRSPSSVGSRFWRCECYSWKSGW